MSRLQSRKGQVSIMIALMTVTFGFFFVFVVATGVLVSAKINLQNAADMAAYAGAAVQARQLNNISFLNYEMRRQYKKFLFRYYILGTKAYAPQVGAGPRYWSLNGKADSAFNVPSVCVTFNQKSNHCMVDKLRPISVPKANPLDSVSQVLSDQLAELEKIRKTQCGASWYTNRMLLSLWLFNTDPTLEAVKADLAADTGSDPQTREVLETIQSLSQGLGLVPRLALLRKRISSIEQMINNPPPSDPISFDSAQSLRTSTNPALFEREIQAFLSAYYTLGSGDPTDTFPGAQIRLTEFLPSKLIQMDPIPADFASYFTYFDIASDGTCLPYPVGFHIANLPVGYFKDPQFLTYYSVRVDAQANLLFRKRMFPGSPFTLHLRAYSAAQPFGSRVGPGPPRFTKNDFTRAAKPNFPGMVLGGSFDACLSFPGGNCPPLPNLVLKGSTGDYWDPIIYQQFQSPNMIPLVGGVIRLDDPDIYSNAMYPNPSEIGKYNILNDFVLRGGDSSSRKLAFNQYFPQAPANSPVQESVYSIFAPVTKPGESAADAAKEIAQLIDQSFTSLDSFGGVGNIQGAQLKANLITQMTSYLTLLAKGKGEDGEGNYIARLRNPFKGKPIGGGYTNLTGVPGLGIDVSESGYPKSLNNSWVTDKYTQVKNTGRLGYSVKFISFKALRGAGGGTSNGVDPWINGTPANPDSDSESDMEALQH